MDRSLLAAAVLAIAGAAGSSGACASAEAFPIAAVSPPGGALRSAPAGSHRSAVARVLPSVVTVHAARALKGAKTSSAKVLVHNVGSGVVIDRDGDIVTNYHVVQDATNLGIVLADGTLLPCRVLGVDADSDLALLHVDASNLPAIAIADIEDVEPGDIVLAIGNPLGVGQSVTQGVVSAVVRKGTRPVENFIQTDAAINPGNSGGPLVDTAGRLVGINAVILTQSGGSEGIGFAIPVDLVQTVVASLKARGRVARGWFGWSATALDGESVLVIGVDGNGPAHRAGILPGDVLVRVGGRRVQRPLEAGDVVIGSDPGTHVPVEVMRRGVPATFDVELAPVPALRDDAR
jgi:S1-C subfamily serine protease